jgi:hypothetical protein
MRLSKDRREWLLLVVPPFVSALTRLLLRSGTTATKFTAAFRKLGDPKIWDGENSGSSLSR